MFKRINILLCFLLILAFDRTTAQDNFNIFTPEFIQSNSNFEISIITSKKFPEAEKLDIFISPDISLIINRVELLAQDQKSQISIRSEFIKDYSEQFQKISIDLTDTTLFSDGSYFQLIISLKSTQAASNNLKFFGEFFEEDKLIGYLVNSKLNVVPETNYLYDLSLNYYQKYSIAGSALSLTQGSYLNIPLIYSFDNKLAVECWMEFKNSLATFLEIINWGTNRVEYSLTINENQILIVRFFK